MFHNSLGLQLLSWNNFIHSLQIHFYIFFLNYWFKWRSSMFNSINCLKMTFLWKKFLLHLYIVIQCNIFLVWIKNWYIVKFNLIFFLEEWIFTFFKWKIWFWTYAMDFCENNFPNSLDFQKKRDFFAKCVQHVPTSSQNI